MRGGHPWAFCTANVVPRYVDQLGNMRPVISFQIPEDTLRGVVYAREFAKLAFARLGVADHTPASSRARRRHHRLQPIFAALAEADDGWPVVEAEQDPAKANPLGF